LGQEQETIPTLREEGILEAQVISTETETEDDSYLQQLQYFLRHPLPVNTSDETGLRELGLLTELQIHSLVTYRSLFGKLISIYELQAIPGWDIETIRKVSKMLTVLDREPLVKTITQRMKGGAHNLLMRTSIIPERSSGYLKNDTSAGSGYLGGRSRMFFRYRYSYKNIFQYGVLGDKDAGEQFFAGKQKAGFDFYSYHLFVRKMGIVEALALGDYTVNMGQGLIHWQSNGLRKNADAMMIKRQGHTLRPYNSAGEYNFHRGVGITLKFKMIELTSFASNRKFTASLDGDEDGIFVSSIIASGYHRTQLETDKRQNLNTLVAGAILKYLLPRGNISLNTVHYKFAIPLKPQDKPYDRFDIKGDYWSNYSFDYSYTIKNIHAYGEIATDRNNNLALLQSVLVSVDKRMDLSVVYRNISKSYQTIAGNAFTENSMPSNERGIYGGIVLRPRHGWVMNIYADFFETPWLRFRTDAPATGRGYLLQMVHTPNRQVEIYMRYSNEQKQLNSSGSILSLPEIGYTSRKEWRAQFATQISKQWLFRSRVSLSWYAVDQLLPKKGFLGFSDLVWKPPYKYISGSLRLQYFDTEDYETRIYAYENGALYDMSIPAFYGKGWRYYINLHSKLSFFKHRYELDIWLKYAALVQTYKTFFGSGLDKIERPSRSEIKLQFQVAF
jgi:hypothetical protein